MLDLVALAPAAGDAAAADVPAAGDAASAELVLVHGVTWLVVANAVGVLMSALLVVPALGTLIEPWSFGRWAPLHLDLALYGWCGLPLVGLLLRLYSPPAGAGPLGALAVHVWSGSLAAGAVAWLAGQTTGKPFLDWTGAARLVFLANLVILGGVLLALFRAQLTAQRAAGHGGRRRLVAVGGKAGLWLALMTVPIAMALATDPARYPPINPASGGPTPVNLLGSTLVVVAIVLAVPSILGVPRSPRRTSRRLTIAALALHAVVFLLLGHGDQSGRDPAALVALASVLPWAWLLPRDLMGFVWPPRSRPWLLAFAAWWAALVASAVLMAVPPVLRHVKFTNVLVAHAHLAMAAMATSFVALVLVALTRGTALEGALASTRAFVLWQAGCVAHVATLAAAGLLEVSEPGVAFGLDGRMTALYVARGVTGAVMLAASVTWLARALRRGAA